MYGFRFTTVPLVVIGAQSLLLHVLTESCCPSAEKVHAMEKENEIQTANEVKVHQFTFKHSVIMRDGYYSFVIIK